MFRLFHALPACSLLYPSSEQASGICRSGFNLPSQSEATKRKDRDPVGREGELGGSEDLVASFRPGSCALKSQMAEARMAFWEEAGSFGGVLLRALRSTAC